MAFPDGTIFGLRRFLPRLVVVLSLIGIPLSWAEAVRADTACLKEIRYWSASDHTRVVLDMDQSVRYEVHRLESDRSANMPQRIYIDLFQTRCAEDLPRRIKLEKGPVELIRTWDREENTGRLVLNLRQAKDYEVFRLDRPDRIVMDLWWNQRDRTKVERRSTTGMERAKPTGPQLPLIVLDPGHGGHDPGAIGRGGLKEKDVAFSIAVELQRVLTARKIARAVLTRNGDTFLSLAERTRFANTRNADLFVSIHANASKSRKARGVETYYLDNATDAASIRLAALENRTSGKKMDELQCILRDLRLSANANESNLLAWTLQGAIVGNLAGTYTSVNDLGAKGNLFYVLLGAHMPSVLVEVSFISNEMEEERLKDPKYRKVIALGIADGIERYMQDDSGVRLVAGSRLD